MVVPILLTALITAAVFGFGGYYLGTRTVTQRSADLIQPTPTISPEVTSTSPTTTVTPTISLTKYSSKLEKLSFWYPSDWKLIPQEPSNPAGDILNIQDPTGKVGVSWIGVLDGIGGSCDPNIPFSQKEGEMGAPCPLFEVVDQQKLANADLSYVSYVTTNDGVSYTPVFALQDKNGLFTTKRGLVYLLFTGINNGGTNAGLTGHGPKYGTKAEAQNFYTTSVGIQAKNILLSASY